MSYAYIFKNSTYPPDIKHNGKLVLHIGLYI